MSGRKRVTGIFGDLEPAKGRPWNGRRRNGCPGVWALELRSGLTLQTAVDAEEDLAGASTLCRLGNRMGRAEAARLHEALLNQFIVSFQSPPRHLVPDFHATDEPAHSCNTRANLNDNLVYAVNLYLIERSNLRIEKREIDSGSN